MSLDADAIVDRRRMKRRLAVWRVAAVAVALALVAALFWRGEGLPLRDYVAQVDLSGVLLDDHARIEAVREAAANERVRALVVAINSPGGTVVAGEALFHAVRDVAQIKPVVAVIGGVGASAGYLVAIAADHVIARESSITGSIGVLIQTADVTELLAKLGISADAIKSTPLKDQPSPFEALSPEARAATQAVVNDTYRWFVDLVAQRRQLSPATALQLADGRVYTGRQAVSLSLIDAVGGLEEARQWLQDNHGVGRDLPLLPVGADRISVAASLVGMARKTLFSETLRLDGLVSLWQPDGLR